MPLTNAQYDEIQRSYDQRQLENQRRLQEKKNELFQAAPRLKEIEDAISETSVKYADRLLDGDPKALSQLHQELEAYRKERRLIYQSMGLNEHALEPEYTCPDCRDTGRINGKPCHCFKQAAIDLVYTQSNIRLILQNENFAHFNIDLYSNEEKDAKTNQTARQIAQNALHSSLDFINNFDSNFDNLFLYGNPGVGKTFLSNCIAKELLDTGHSVIYFTAFQLFDILEKNKFQKDSSSAGAMKNIFECDLLIIDDLGTELPNTFTLSQLFLCLNERILRKKSTIISTNLGIKELHDVYSERIFSRVLSNYTLIHLFGSDIRIATRKH